MNRTKTYFFTLSLLFFSGILFAQDVTQDAAIKIEDLNASSVGIYDAGAGNQVRILAPDYTDISGARAVSWVEGLNIQCYNDNGSGTSEYRAAFFSNDQTGYQSVYYPYLQIEAEEGTTITHIAFKAYNLNNAAGMTYGFSSGKGLGLTENDFEIIYSDFIPNVPFPDSPLHIDRGASNACVLCKLTVSGIEKIPVSEDKQTIRIAARTNFPSSAGGTFIDVVQPFYLLGIYIWTDQGLPSSVSLQEENKINRYVQDGRLCFAEEMQRVEIYSLSGLLVSRKNNTSSVSLLSFPEGFYLVRAIDRNHQQHTIKVQR